MNIPIHAQATQEFQRAPFREEMSILAYLSLWELLIWHISTKMQIQTIVVSILLGILIPVSLNSQNH